MSEIASARINTFGTAPKADFESPSEEAVFIKGAQSNIWSEYMSNDKKVEYMIFPRLTALSEVLWSMPDHKNWDDFKNRLPLQFKRYDLWKVNYNAHGINKGE